MQVRDLLIDLPRRTRSLMAFGGGALAALLAMMMGCTTAPKVDEARAGGAGSDSVADARLALLPLGEKIVEIEVVSDAARDSAGRLYVIDGLTPRIVAFNSRLEPTAATGRRGGGPGEFREPIALAVVRPGRVAVLDRALRRLSFFDLHEGSSRMERAGSIALRMPTEGLCVLGEGQYLIYGFVEGRRLHVIDSVGRAGRSFAPVYAGLSSMAAELASAGRMSCDIAADEVVLTSRFLPIVEAFRLSTGERLWTDTLRPFRPLELTDEGGRVTIASGPSGYSVVRSVFHAQGLLIIQAFYDARTDGARVDTVVTYSREIEGGRWLPYDLRLPLLVRLDDSLVVSRGELALVEAVRIYRLRREDDRTVGAQ